MMQQNDDLEGAAAANAKISLLEEPLLLASTNDKKNNNEVPKWPLVHGDVFRAPPYLPMFAAHIGSGSQVFTEAVSFIVLGMLGPFAFAGQMHNHEARGQGMMDTLLVGCFSLSNIVCGYRSASFFQSYIGDSNTDDKVAAFIFMLVGQLNNSP